MKRIIITAATLLAVAPASLGLLGNASFAQNIPVSVPSQASVLDDRGGLRPHAEPGDDKGGQNTHAEPGDDKGSDSGSGKGDTGADDSLKSSRDGGSGHS